MYHPSVFTAVMASIVVSTVAASKSGSAEADTLMAAFHAARTLHQRSQYPYPFHISHRRATGHGGEFVLSFIPSFGRCVGLWRVVSWSVCGQVVDRHPICQFVVGSVVLRTV